MPVYPNPTFYPPIDQNSATVIKFYLRDSTDHLTPKTGVAGSTTVKLIKGDGTLATPAGSVSEIGLGWYKIALTAAETGVLGDLVISATQAASDPVSDHYTVVGSAGVNNTSWTFAHDTGMAGVANGYLYTYNPKT